MSATLCRRCGHLGDVLDDGLCPQCSQDEMADWALEDRHVMASDPARARRRLGAEDAHMTHYFAHNAAAFVVLAVGSVLAVAAGALMLVAAVTAAAELRDEADEAEVLWRQPSHVKTRRPVRPYDWAREGA